MTTHTSETTLAPTKSSRSVSPVPTSYIQSHLNSSPHLPHTHLKSRSRRSSISSIGSLELIESPMPTKLHRIQRLAPFQKTLSSKQSHNRLTRQRSADSQSTAWSNKESVGGSIAQSCGMEAANAKRNQDFHALFRSVPDNDLLIEDYGCALQKEILLQGRIYISESHICFNANIFGWVTNLVIAFDDIIDIERRATAIIIPNAILISTVTAKYFFASFLSREQAYEQIVDLWQKKRSPVQILTEDTETLVTVETSTLNSSEEETDSEDEVKSKGKLDSSVVSLPVEKHLKPIQYESARSRAYSEAATRPNILKIVRKQKSQSYENIKVAPENIEDGPKKASSPLALPVPQTQAPVQTKTECDCIKRNDHFPVTIMDQIYTGTIENIYNLLYNSSFLTKFLTDVEKCTDVTLGEWQKGEEQVKLMREVSYIKYLGASIGPKTTKCISKEKIQHLDFNGFVTQLTTTQTPDVPAGGSFFVNTRTCISIADKMKVRVLVTVSVDFIKSSWLKSTIEKACIEGQTNYYKSLDRAILQCTTTDVPKLEKKKHTKKSRVRQEEPTPNIELEVNNSSDKSFDIGTIIQWLIENAKIPTVPQLTVICLILMVFSNIYIAFKMANVSSQLNESHETSYSHSNAMNSHEWNQENIKEAQRLWQWLDGLDPSIVKQDSKEKSPSSEELSADEGSFADSQQGKNSQEQNSNNLHLKNREQLEHHLIALEKMVRVTGQSMEEATRIVEQQRQKLYSAWLE